MKRFFDRFPRMKMQDDALLGKPGKRVIIEILIFALVFLIANSIESIPMTVITVVEMFTNDEIISETEALREQFLSGTPGLDSFIAYVEKVTELLTSAVVLPMLFLTVVAVVVVIIYCTKLEKRPLRSLGLRRQNAVTEYLIGMAVGLGIFSAAVGICAAAGTLSVTGTGKMALVPVFFLGYLLQGFSEEIMLRGYLMMSIQRKNSMASAVLWNSVIFAALHLANPGIGLIAVVNLFLFGVFASLYFLRRGSLWGIAALHSVWNFVQGNFWGIRVSGMANSDTVFVSEIGDGIFAKLINGGSFGLEGGFGVTVVLLLGITVLTFLPSKRNEISELPASPAPAPDAAV